MTQKQSKGTAVVTGASSGIGAVYADRLARRGYDVVLVARNEQRLPALATRLRADTGRAVRVAKADLSDKSDLARVEALLKDDASISLVVNNAGFGSVTPLLASDVDTMESTIDLNVTALTRLTYAAVPATVKRGSGTVINIASVVAIGPEILNGVYGACKAFVLVLTQSMQHELARKGIRVQALLPGATDTEGWDIAGMPKGQRPPSWVMPAEDMVDAALAGFDAGEVVTIPPLQDGDDWTRYEAGRNELRLRFAHSRPGARYLT
jgi:hypothetical protein